MPYKNNVTLFKRNKNFVLILFFCSGISSLIFEVVWLRQLTIILGNTVFAVSAVLTVFMGGLALGSFLSGRMIDRRNDPLRVYALIEISIGLLGFFLTSILNQTGPVYILFHNSLGENLILQYIARYVFSFFLLIIPTTLMGATLPVLSRFVVENKYSLGLNIGRLYALNTLGAAGGCYLAGFMFIGNLGIRVTVLIASVLSVTVGTLAWYYNKRLSESGIIVYKSPEFESESSHKESTFRILILSVFAISGFVALGYEVLWTRVLVSYLGNSVYAFSTMLTTFLIGIAVGSLVLSSFVDQRKRLVTGFGLIEVAIGFYVLLSIYILGWSVDKLAMVKQPYPVWQWTGLRFMKAFALMFVPTFFFGATFPVAGRIYTINFRRVGQSIGELYTWNTLGAIIGSAVTGFVLMPMLGIEKSLLVLLCMNLCIGMALCAAEPKMTHKKRFLLLAAVALTTVIGLSGIPKNIFRHMQELSYPPAEVIYYKEDLAGTVTVKQKNESRMLSIDNLDVAGTHILFLSSSKSLGHLPMLLHPNPRSVFVLGFGGGGTAYSISTYPEVERIDAAELSRSIVNAAPLFDKINHNIISEPRLNIVVNDGRNFLLTSRRTYDVISVDLNWPQTSGSGSLYTREFYEICRDRLNENGIMVEWLNMGFIPVQYLQTILRTVQQVFPNTSLWWTYRQAHLLLVASKTPLSIDFQLLTRKMNHPPTQRDLAEVHLDEPAEFLSYFIAEGDDLLKFTQGSQLINTDNFPIIEYKLPRFTSLALEGNTEAMMKIKKSILPFINNINSVQKERLLACERSYNLLVSSSVAFYKGEYELTIANCLEALKLNPHSHEAKYWLGYYHIVIPQMLQNRNPNPPPY